MAQKNNIDASILIVNFNNAKYLKKSIESALNQSYKNKEVIVVDDISDDQSVDILNHYKKKIKFFINKKKTKYGSYNQINSLYNAYLISRGKYLFFLDSDDFFKKNKLENLIKKYKNDSTIDVIFDLPIYKFKNKIFKKKFKQKKFILSDWPRFTPQSCISVRRNYAKFFFKHLRIKKYPTIWFDFRLAIFSFIKNKEIFVLKNYLTYYRQLDNSASKRYKMFTKNWWVRRMEAHNFFSFVSKKLKQKYKLSIDKLITTIVYKFIYE